METTRCGGFGREIEWICGLEMGVFQGAGNRCLGKHHIDTNHHVNNAQYVEIAREVLPSEIEVGELRVEYKKAAVCGDVVYPHVSRTDEGYTVSLCDEQGAAYAVIWLRGKTREDII